VAPSSYFTAHTFRFLEELAENNSREWFNDHKARYEEHVKEPALSFIFDFAGPLKKISPYFTAGPRSLFRIHRDTRFAKDKSPYKTYTGIQFRHDQGGNVHAPGFYLHIQPKGVFAGAGLWRPDAQSLYRIRERIAEDPTAWKRASRDKSFAATFELEGEALARVPKGFAPDHPFGEDLKRKDFIGVKTLSDAFLTGPALPKELADLYSASKPFVRFLCGAVGLPF
jgi:uncharacterized protein (TIGR02453 family)